MNIPRNHIEFRDTSPAEHGHVAHTIMIDGNEVLVKEGSVDLVHGPDQFTSVTLTLLPSRVSFH